MRPLALLLGLTGLLGCGPQTPEDLPTDARIQALQTPTGGCGGCVSTAASYPMIPGCGADKRKLAEAAVRDGSGRQVGTVRHMYSPTCWQVWAEYESTSGPATPPLSGLVRAQVTQANAYGLGTGCGCWAQVNGTTLTSPVAAVGYTWAGVDQSRVVACIDGACGGTTLRPPR